VRKAAGAIHRQDGLYRLSITHILLQPLRHAILQILESNESFVIPS
jgi:hypothetical protein